MKVNQDSTLKGIPSILQTLGVTPKGLSEQTDLSYQHAYRICKAKQGCSIGVLRGIAQYLSCCADDLLSTPTPARLAEIRAAFDERRAAQSRAAADQARAVAS